jgi:hypothetical protein
MARATSRLAGWPVVYDLSQITHLTRVFPKYDPIVRRIETITRRLRERKFAVRVGAEIGFQVPHSRAMNFSARFYDVLGQNLLRSANDLSAGPWTANFCTVARSPERDPIGNLDAWRITDATGAANGNLAQTTLEGGSAGRLSWYFRADAPHPTSARILPGTMSVQAGTFWKHAALNTGPLTTPVSGFQTSLSVFADADVAPQGAVDLFLPDVRSIELLPGTDEEILADLKDKLASDDWDVELTLDGGLTWRDVLLDEHEKVPLEDKWIGYSERFVLTCSQPLTRVPPTLDGIW